MKIWGQESKQEGLEVRMNLDAEETEGKPLWLGHKQSCRVGRGQVMLGLEAVVIAAAFHIFQWLPSRHVVGIHSLVLLGGPAGPVVANELGVEVSFLG